MNSLASFVYILLYTFHTNHIEKKKVYKTRDLIRNQADDIFQTVPWIDIMVSACLKNFTPANAHFVAKMVYLTKI